ncbi:unnamed protein product, partial [Oikopleura dioica]
YQKEIAERITGMEDNLTPIYPEISSEMNEVELRRGFNSLQYKLVTAVESRDKRQKQLNEALQERDQVVFNTGNIMTKTVPESPGRQNTHSELAEAKSMIRLLKEELTEKEEFAGLSEKEAEISRAREKEAREEIHNLRALLAQARADQDEIDELRTKAEQLNRTQQESSRLREKLSDLSFYKARVEELQRDNSSLYEARAALETEISALRIRFQSLGDEHEINLRLRDQIGDLEDQNMELNQKMQGLQDDLRGLNIDRNNSLDTIAEEPGVSFIEEADRLNAPEIIQLRCDNQRLRTLNAALQEQQKSHSRRVGDLETDLYKAVDENKRLKQDLLSANNSLIDFKEFAQESVKDGVDIDEIVRRIQERDDEQRHNIEEKVWESRIKEAHEKYEMIKEESETAASRALVAEDKLEQITSELKIAAEKERKKYEKELLEKEGNLLGTEKSLRIAQREVENLIRQQEQQKLEEEQHQRSESRRIQLETEIDKQRAHIDRLTDIIERRDEAIKKMEKEVDTATSAKRAADSTIRQLKNSASPSDLVDSEHVTQLNHELKKKEAELKQIKRRAEQEMREKDNLAAEVKAAQSKAQRLSAEIRERDENINDLRSADLSRAQLQRDFELQKSLNEKIQQSLVDEKVKYQSLSAEAKAARKRADRLEKLEIENEDIRRKCRALEREMATTNDVQNDVGEIRNALEDMGRQLHDKEIENEQLKNQLSVLEDMSNDGETSDASAHLHKKIAALEVEIDVANEKQQELARRLQSEQESFQAKIQFEEDKRKLILEERDMVKEQLEKQGRFLDQLSAEADKNAQERDNIRQEYNLLLKEYNLLKAQFDRLKQEHRILSRNLKEKDNDINQLKAFEADRSILVDENNAVKETNSRLKTSYSKLKNDYNEIVDDLRSLKVKYNKFKVEHAKTDASYKRAQSQKNEVDRELQDFNEKYQVLNELKEKISLENSFLQKQNTNLMEHNKLLNSDTHKTKDKYNEEQKNWQQKLHDVQRQKERIEEKLLQAHLKSPSPTKPKKNTFQKLKETFRSGKSTKRKSEKPSLEVTLKSDSVDGTLAIDGTSLRNPSDNTLDGSISSCPSEDASRSRRISASATGDSALTLEQLLPDEKANEKLSMTEFLAENGFSSRDHEIPVAESTQLNHHSIHLSRENSHFEASSHEPSLLDDELNRSRNSIKSATSSEIRRISEGALRRAPNFPVPKERKNSSGSSSNSEMRSIYRNENKPPPPYRPPSENESRSRPHSLSASFTGHELEQVANKLSPTIGTSSLSRSMNHHTDPTRSSMDRLTARKTNFHQRDRFAESMARLRGESGKLFPDPRTMSRSSRESSSNTPDKDHPDDFHTLGYV